MNVDVAVVGAGPAGLVAARRLAESGLDVVVLDEQPRPGGQYFRQVSAAVAAEAGVHRPDGAELIAAATAAGARLLSGTTVWGVADDGRSLLTWHADRGIGVVTAAHVVVATGSAERVLPFAGWTSPRVTTVGYAQHLAAEGVPVAARVLIAGSGPFLLPVACSLLDRGARVVAVLEAGTPYRPDLASRAVLRHPARLAEFAGFRLRLLRAGVPLRCGRMVTSATGHDGAVTVAAEGPHGREEYHADVLCVGYGFRAQVDLLRLLGARTRLDDGSGDEFAVIRADGSTDADGVWAAGEVTGVAGAACAQAEAAVVAAGILARYGRPIDVAAELAAVQRARAFATAMTARYPTPRALAKRATNVLAPEAIVCRCEAVTAGAVRAAVTSTGSDLDALKAATRAGMGLCQGRECAPGLAALCGAPAAAFTPRAPLRPIPLGALADGIVP